MNWATFPSALVAQVSDAQDAACGLPRRCYGKIGSGPHATDRGEVWTLHYDSPIDLSFPPNQSALRVFDHPGVPAFAAAAVANAGPWNEEWEFPGQGAEEPPGLEKKQQ